MDIYQDQARTLKTLREKRGLSQAQLAYLVQVKQPSIAYYERCGVANVAIASRLSKVLKTSLDTFRV